MKRWRRAVLGIVFAGFTLWTCRAFYVFQVWQIAYVWYPMVPQPSFGNCALACLSPRSAATTSHGLFADMAFLRIPLSLEDADDELSRQSFGALGSYGTLVPVPIPDEHPETGCDGGPIRSDPRTVPVSEWGRCYNAVDLFDTRSVKEGGAIRRTGDKGGMVLFDRRRKLLHIAVYQTH